MDFNTLPDEELLVLFYKTEQELNDPEYQGHNRVLAAQLGELGHILHARGIDPDE